MDWQSLDEIWINNKKQTDLKVRFNDWNHTMKYFLITGESSDGKRLVGKLDNGESISYSKRSRGWSLYAAQFSERAGAV